MSIQLVGVPSEMYGPPSDCKGKSVGRETCLTRPLRGAPRFVVLAGVARAEQYKGTYPEYGPGIASKDAVRSQFMVPLARGPCEALSTPSDLLGEQVASEPVLVPHPTRR